MKLKKEFIILIIIIAALSAYLYFQKKGKTHYSLPTLEKIEKKDVSKLVIKKGDTAIVLERENDKWLILPENFPARKATIKNMLKDISNITLTALASESKNYPIYELDEKNRIEVEIYDKNKSLRRIDIGKAASSFRHTFIKLSNDYRVFHANGNLRNVFDKKVSDLRDKKVISFDDDITEVSLTDGKKKMTIVKSSLPPEVNPNEQGQDEKDERKVLEVMWTDDRGKPVKKKEIDDIINTLSDLECDGFIEDRKKEELTTLVYTLVLKGARSYSLSFYEKEEDKYPATSSESKYPFFIAGWRAKNIMKDFDSLRKESKE